MRGTVTFRGLGLFIKGITPAHAGNSGFVSGNNNGPKDHPRSCGEQAAAAVTKGIVEGSPPLMRGTVLRKGMTVHCARITPAHAGNRYVLDDNTGRI